MPDINLGHFFSPDAVKESYQRYKAAKTDRYRATRIRIPMGSDGITWQDFERNLDKNAANISRRVLNGSYQFYPLREVEVEKPDGGTRVLSIASIRDALVQRQLYAALYSSAEEMFAKPGLDKVSFAYRRGKSAPYAAHLIWQSFKRGGYGYAFDADIRKFFDNLNHDQLMDLVEAWIGRETTAGKLLWRYIRTDRVPYGSYPHSSGWEKHFMENKPQRVPRQKGVPQGGALSGLLANLYLHEFDCWVVAEKAQQSDFRYYRYADDFVMLTHTEEDAYALYEPVRAKLKDLHLDLHPLAGPERKTKVSNIAEGELVFLGFHFMADRVRAKPDNIHRFKDRFQEALGKESSLRSKSHEWDTRLRLAVRWCVNPKILGPEPEQCEKCGLPTDRRRSWMAFFASVISDVDQLRQLDRWMRQQVCKYFRDHYRVRIGRRELRKAGMRSLVREYYRQRSAPTEVCSCHPS
ncbi:MAG: hypothetical protein IMY83_02195 [Chloroflexi bacterium]|nr:hypothetical protein [Chloroflexota bacterium]